MKNHAERMWVCDFIQTHDLLFRQVYAFFLVHLASRRVVHIAATRHPTQAWTAQQLRNVTMDGDAPAVLLRDRDDTFHVLRQAGRAKAVQDRCSSRWLRATTSTPWQIARRGR